MSWDIFGGTGDMIDSFLHPERGYEDASKKMEDAWRKSQEFQDPYRQSGLDQRDRLNNAENNLLDPSKLLADWMSKYQESPYAKQSMANAKESGLDAASSMGLMGSSGALNNIQQSSSDFMNKDRQSFLNDMMQKYMAGIGIGQNMFNVGADTAGRMGQQRLAAGGYLGDMAYGARNAPGNRLADMISAASKAYSAGGHRVARDRRVLPEYEHVWNTGRRHGG
mgnify:CR=1 FL=1